MAPIKLQRRSGGNIAQRFLSAIFLALVCSTGMAAQQTVPLYTYYEDPPLDARSPKNLTGKLAEWLSARSNGRYHFVATQLPRAQLDALIAQPSWAGAVAWANPSWFADVDRQRYHWTGAFMQDSDIVLSRKSHPVEYMDEGQSLKGLRVCTVTGYRLSDVGWMIDSGKLHRVDARSELDCVRLLQAGRVDAAFVQAISMAYFRRMLPGIDASLSVATQPRGTFSRHLFAARGNLDMRSFLDAQRGALQRDPAWLQVLPKPLRQLRLVSIHGLSSAYRQSLQHLLDAVFKRAGLSYSLTVRPSERAMRELRNGQFDGDIARLTGFSAAVPGALKITPAHSTILQLAISLSDGPKLTRWEDLRGLRVAVPRGFLRTEQRVDALARRESPATLESCVQMVVQRHVDVCVLSAYSKTDWPGQQTSKAALKAQLIDASDVYMWLRPGLDDEARALSDALSNLEKSGNLARQMGGVRR